MDTGAVKQGFNAAAQVADVAKGVDALPTQNPAGGPDPLQGVSIVVCPNSRIVAGYGNIGLVELRGNMKLTDVVAEVAKRRDEIRALAQSDPTRMYQFVVI